MTIGLDIETVFHSASNLMFIVSFQKVFFVEFLFIVGTVSKFPLRVVGLGPSIVCQLDLCNFTFTTLDRDYIIR